VFGSFNLALVPDGVHARYATAHAVSEGRAAVARAVPVLVARVQRLG
jgi:hypothetical protein